MGKRTPLYEEHKNLGATIIDFGGWDMPVYYTNVIDEHNAARNAAALFDICHMGEIMIEGKQAFDLLQKTMSRDIGKLKEGKMALAVMCNEKGGILDDLTIYKFSEEKYMVVVNASNIEKDFNWIRKVNEENKFGTVVKDITEKTAKLDFQGPNAVEVLQQLVDFDLSEIEFYGFKEGKIDGVDAIVSRSGYTCEDGFEIYFSWGVAKQVWNKILEVGKDSGIKPAGLGARDTLRLECAMNLYGNEMDESKTPLQARYCWVVDFEKDFIGKKNLLKQKEEGVKEKLVGFEMLEGGIARHGYKIFKDGKEVGFVTSGTLGPTLKKAIGLCYIITKLSEAETEIEVEIRERKYKAKIVKLPFYKGTCKV